MPTTITDRDGNPSYVREGKSADISGTFVGPDGVVIEKIRLLSLNLTLYDKSSNTGINSRNAVDVLDDHGGTVDDDGTFRIELNAADNPIVATDPAAGTREVHVARLEWTWDDGSTGTGGDSTRSGGDNLEFEVEAWAAPTF